MHASSPLQDLQTVYNALNQLHQVLMDCTAPTDSQPQQHQCQQQQQRLTHKQQELIQQWWENSFNKNTTASAASLSAAPGTFEVPADCGTNSSSRSSSSTSVGGHDSLPAAVAALTPHLLYCYQCTAHALSAVALNVPPAVARCFPCSTGSSSSSGATPVQQLQQDILQSAKLVLSTVSMAGSSSMAEAGAFDLCVIDEAAQLVEAESCIVLARWPGLRGLVLVGDHRQLPATVISQEAKSRGYGRSLFERLVERGFRWVWLGCL